MVKLGYDHDPFDGQCSHFDLSTSPESSKKVVPCPPKTSVQLNGLRSNTYYKVTVVVQTVAKFSQHPASSGKVIAGSWTCRFTLHVFTACLHTMRMFCLDSSVGGWHNAVNDATSFASIFCSLYGLYGSNVPRFICWLRHYWNCLFVYLTCLLSFFLTFFPYTFLKFIYFLTRLLPDLSDLSVYFFQNRPIPFPCCRS